MPASPNLTAAADFVWRNARLLDRARFAYLFQGGPRAAVIEALRPYQNGDGGFGNALEPDLRGPESQPQGAEVALWRLDEVNCFPAAMVERACDYLMTITTPDGGVPYVLPSVRAHPHAPWWETDDDPPASVNPTAPIAGLLHKHGVDHPWVGTATEFCWRAIETLEDLEPYDARAILVFLDYVPDRPRAEAAFARVGAMIVDRGLVALDPAAEGHVHSPLQFAPRPEVMARRLFTDAVIETHLDALVAAQAEDGGWPINWTAFTPAAGIEWRGWMTVNALHTLRAYGRPA